MGGAGAAAAQEQQPVRPVARPPQVINRIIHRLSTGCQRRRLPEHERAINELKQFRGVATRYDKCANAYLGTVTADPLLIWLRS